MSAAPLQAHRVVKAGTVTRLDLAGRAAAASAAAESAARRAEIGAAFTAGRAEGEQAGGAAAAAAADRLTAEIARLRAAVLAERSSLQAALVDDVLATALVVAEWVLRAEVTGNGRVLLERLGEATRDLPDADDPLLLEVCPADEPLLREVSAGPLAGARLRIDPTLQPGEARLAAGSSRVELTVAAALRSAAGLLGVPPAVPAAPTQPGAAVAPVGNPAP